MPTGIVKWFNSAKGYGFICPENGGQDVFAHFSAIIMDGYKCLKAGQMVSYEVNEGPKGLHALNIRPQTNEVDFEATKSALRLDKVGEEAGA